MTDLLGVLYYALLWPLASVASALVDEALVAVGVKRVVATGRAVWR